MKTYFKLTLSFFLFFGLVNTTFAQAEQYGQASYYSDAFQGEKTASGSKYDKTKMTCAHNDYPFGSTIKVTHLENKKSVVVKVTDRGPYIKGRIVDLSRAAAQKIGLINDGVAQVKVELVSSKKKSSDQLSAKGDKKPDEYSTAPSRRAVEEKIKRSTARATDSTKGKGGSTKAKKATAKKAVVAAAATKKEDKKEELTEKGDDAPEALPVMTAKDMKNADLYQITILKPKKEGYGVQVASLSDYDGVLKKVAELQGRFFKNILIRTEKGDGAPIYKIILGQYETRDQANSYKKDLKKKKKINGFVVALGDEETEE